MQAGWTAMGKPDFSACGRLFYRLPAEIRETLSRSEEKVVVWSLFFAWKSSHSSGRNTALFSYSQAWIGGKFGRSRWTVGRALDRLSELGILTTIRRSPNPDGSFQTNLIALGHRLLSTLGLVSDQENSGSNSIGRSQKREKSENSPQVADLSPCSKSAPQQVENLNKSQGGVAFQAPPLGNQEEEGTCLEKARQLFASWSKKVGQKLGSA